jgi:hypothetical protein
MVDLELANRVVLYLNQLTESDRPAIAALITNRVPCNKELASHPTCQVGQQHGGYNVGILGVLNGVCGVYDDGPMKGYGPIAAMFNSGKTEAFRDLTGFFVLKNL